MRTEKTADRTAILAGSRAVRRLVAAACVFAFGLAAAAEPPRTWIEPLTGMTFVALPKGCFMMGTAKPVAPPWDSSWERMGYAGNLAEDEMPRHEVCVDAIWIAKTEVTEADWHKVMGGEPPAGDGRRAKAGVTWLQAREFAERLNEKSAGKQRFRLPTEAEWEYACRAGDSEEPMLDSSQLSTKAWQATSPKRSYETREVGILQANAFGLHDMLGNAWEWTADSYLSDGYGRHKLYNPRVEVADAPRVIRGGSFMSELSQTRCTLRGRYRPGDTLGSIGMRLVRE